MQDKQTELLMLEGIEVKKSPINQRLGSPGEYMVQLYVNGKPLDPSICPHFEDVRSIAKWQKRFPMNTNLTIE